MQGQRPIFGLEYENADYSTKQSPFIGHLSFLLVTADFNGDSLPDILDFGYEPNSSEAPSFHYYLSTDTAVYEENLSLSNYYFGMIGAAAAWDIDDDGDKDLLTIGGAQWTGNPETNVFLNDGSGVFTQTNNSQFFSLRRGSIFLMDVDSDGDEDVFLFGTTSATGALQRYELMYFNEGNGIYRIDTVNNFPTVYFANFAKGDLDGDGTLDFILSGCNDQYCDTNVTYVFTNNGNGVFTDDTDTSFGTTQWFGDINVMDINGDGFQDLSLTSLRPGINGYSYFLNDGTGHFTRKGIHIIDTLTYWDYIAGNPDYYDPIDFYFMDAEGDGDPDILMHYLYKDNFTRSAVWFINDGSGHFSFESNRHHFIHAGGRQTTIIEDFNNDGLMDLYNNGSINKTNYSVAAGIYLNDGQGNIELYPKSLFRGLYLQSVYFGDLDGDGAAEILLSGENQAEFLETKLYQNDGKGNFSLLTDSSFRKVERGHIAGGDLNGDSLPELLINGLGGGGLYNNLGLGSFYLDTRNIIDYSKDRQSIFFDIEGDGDLDLFRGSRGALHLLYINDGTGNLSNSNQNSLSLGKARHAGLDTGDIDADGDTDIMVCGSYETGYWYRNDGFTVLDYRAIPNIQAGLNALVLRDFTGNGFPDFFGVGGKQVSLKLQGYYRNDSGAFTRIDTMPIIALSKGAIGAIDLEGDGDLDVLTSGLDPNDETKLYWYINDGSGAFQRAVDSTIVPLSEGTINFADIDKDGDLDLLMTGIDAQGFPRSYLYRNNRLSGLNVPSFSLLADLNLSIFPNPVEEYFTIKRSTKVEAKLRIYTLNGTLEREYELNKPEETIYPQLEQGLYLFRLEENGLVSTKKVWVK
jgi:hypothetical protein